MDKRNNYLRYTPVRTVTLGVAICLIATLFVAPVCTGVWYDCCGDRPEEEAWLDEVIHHCKLMRERCDDADLRRVLDYTIDRYDHVGGFGVKFIPLPACGMNWVLCPGLSIDPEMLDIPVESGAVLLLHEALHDFPPYLGHWHITEREQRFWKLSQSV